MKEKCLFGVAVKSAKCGDNAGKFFLKYGPIYYQEKDLENTKEAKFLFEDKLLPSGITRDQACEITGCDSLLRTFSMFVRSCDANDATMHLFKTEEKLEEDYIEMLIENANNHKSFRKILNNSKI